MVSDIDAGIDLLLGAIYFRLLMTRRELDNVFVSQISETVVTSYVGGPAR